MGNCTNSLPPLVLFAVVGIVCLIWYFEMLKPSQEAEKAVEETVENTENFNPQSYISPLNDPSWNYPQSSSHLYRDVSTCGTY